MPLFLLPIYEKLLEFRFLAGGVLIALVLGVAGVLAPLPPVLKALAVGVGATLLMAGAIEQVRQAALARARKASAPKAPAKTLPSLKTPVKPPVKR